MALGNVGHDADVLRDDGRGARPSGKGRRWRETRLVTSAAGALPHLGAAAVNGRVPSDSARQPDRSWTTSVVVRGLTIDLAGDSVVGYGGSDR